MTINNDKLVADLATNCLNNLSQRQLDERAHRVASNAIRDGLAEMIETGTKIDFTTLVALGTATIWNTGLVG